MHLLPALALPNVEHATNPSSDKPKRPPLPQVRFQFSGSPYPPIDAHLTLRISRCRSLIAARISTYAASIASCGVFPYADQCFAITAWNSHELRRHTSTRLASFTALKCHPRFSHTSGLNPSPHKPANRFAFAVTRT